MKRVIIYQSTDPRSSDITQTFIGTTWDSVDEQQYEYEEYVRHLYTPYNPPYKIKSIKEYEFGKEIEI